jgi:hypothetical protein
MSHQKDELIIYINKITESTRLGEMLWTRINPTTYTWSTDKPKPAKIILQQVQRSTRRIIGGNIIVRTSTHYLFKVIDQHGQEVIAVDGSEDESINTSLSPLYEAILSGFTQKGIEFLKTILPDH